MGLYPILEACPEAARGNPSQDDSRRKPISQLWNIIDCTYRREIRNRSELLIPLSNQELRGLAARMMAAARGYQQEGGAPEIDYYGRAKDLLLLLLQVAYEGAVLQSNPNGIVEACFSPLHSAAEQCVPTPMLRLLLCLYPNELARVDADGRCALHAACAAKYDRRPDYYCAASDMRTGIQILAEQSPPEVLQLPDEEGTLPLHLAIESRVEWNRGINTLVAIAPMTSLTISGWGGRYPFIEAAVTPRPSLTTVYALLRNDPTVLGLARAAGDDNNIPVD